MPSVKMPCCVGVWSSERFSERKEVQKRASDMLWNAKKRKHII
jgi:hypothetical protein